MDQIEQAHHELGRLQAIITRHEGFIFTIRGWLFLVDGGLLAGYYTHNIEIDVWTVRFGLLGIAVLFLLIESRHVNLVEAAVERVGNIEHLIAANRDAIKAGSEPGKPAVDWYGGPRVNVTCLAGARRVFPKAQMTFVLNWGFYLAVVAAIIAISVAMPRKPPPKPVGATTTGLVLLITA